MNKKYILGIIYLSLGVFILFWAQNHSPESGIGEKLSRELSGDYTMSKEGYYFSMVAGALMVVFGAARIFKAKR
jgi:drug/metabolite transporter (DMT)-like permease